MPSNRQENLRNIPQVDKLLNHSKVKESLKAFPPHVQTRIVQDILDSVRNEAKKGETVPSADEIATKVTQKVEVLLAGGLRHAINATGIVLHTNLGRAPLGKTLLTGVVEKLNGYCTLEVDPETGARGSRTDTVEELLSLCFGLNEQAALVVNNNAAALFLVLHTLSNKKTTLISRGEIVQIGGGFKIHEILEASGATLKEVGTTNITHIDDYTKAMNDKVGLILKVHQSCFAITGHTHDTSISDLSKLHERYGIPFVIDLGSGGTVSRPNGDPTIADVLHSGANLVCFSGDKLLGSSQAGIVIGDKELIQKLRKSPLYRALRLGKMDLFVLQETLKDYLLNKTPLVQTLIQTSPDEIRKRAESFAKKLEKKGIKAAVKPATGSIGGGTTPNDVLQTFVIEIEVPDSEAAQRKLLDLSSPIYLRKGKGTLSVDLRTVFVEDEAALLEGIACLF